VVGLSERFVDERRAPAGPAGDPGKLSAPASSETSGLRPPETLCDQPRIVDLSQGANDVEQKVRGCS